MDTVTISKKEYRSLVFAKGLSTKKSVGKKIFMDSAFGIFKKNFTKLNSTSYINKIRKSWR